MRRQPKRAELEPAAPVIPRPGSVQPGVASIRLVGPPAVIRAAAASLADFYGPAWQPGTIKPSRHEGGDQLMYGTLIVPVEHDAP